LTQRDAAAREELRLLRDEIVSLHATMARLMANQNELIEEIKKKPVNNTMTSPLGRPLLRLVLPNSGRV
jgi:hypothetical protein